MNPTLKIGILIAAGIAYLMSRKSTTLEEELEKLRRQVESGNSSIIDYVEERTQKPDELIRESIQITPELEFGNMGGRAWCVRMTWKLKNVSKYTYVITGIKSVCTILGYTCKKWMPGNTSTFVTLKPGQTAEIRSEKDNIILYDEESVRKVLYDAYYKQYDWSDGLDTVTNLRVQSLYGEGTVASYEDLPGEIRQKKGVGYWGLTDGYGQEGENMVGKDL